MSYFDRLDYIIEYVEWFKSQGATPSQAKKMMTTLCKGYGLVGGA